MGYALSDTILCQRIREIVSEKNIRVIVETGIDEGLSTEIFSTLTPVVIGVEINSGRVAAVKGKLNEKGITNAGILLGNSPEVLEGIMPALPEETIFFLDAHGDNYWPLLDEIKAIRRGAGVIIIHDFQVPDHSFSYDSYGGQACCYDYVKEELTRWSSNHRVEYNEKVEGNTAGVGFFFPW